MHSPCGKLEGRSNVSRLFYVTDCYRIQISRTYWCSSKCNSPYQTHLGRSQWHTHSNLRNSLGAPSNIPLTLLLHLGSRWTIPRALLTEFLEITHREKHTTTGPPVSAKTRRLSARKDMLEQTVIKRLVLSTAYGPEEDAWTLW